MLESLFFIEGTKKALPDGEGFAYNFGNPITYPCNP